MNPKNLRTEYKINPLGLETRAPRLSWELESDERNVLQEAYQIICALTEDDPESQANLMWDTGGVASGESIQITYNGGPLVSGRRVYWKVRIWDHHGNVSGWSEWAYWEMGLMQKTDWQAQWIGPDWEEDTSVSTPCPYLRKEFTVRRTIRQATVYITCRGLYELRINGAKTGDQLFTPGWTSYHHRLQYQVYDVTETVQEGNNAVGVILADGWYRGYLGWQGKKNFYGDKLALLFQLKITYDDGSEELIISDAGWKAKTGPILQSDLYNGETYDARLALKGWDECGFDDREWYSVHIRDHGYDNLVASEGEPVRVTETIHPIEAITTPKGERVFDMGQNMVGWVRFTLQGKKGMKIVLNHAEVLDQDGNFYTDNLREAKAEDVYIFGSDEAETYEPRFTFHGFRYIKISGYEGDIAPENISGQVIHSDMLPTGTFACSDELMNRLQQNIQWSLRGNFVDVPTDCPQRDERMGWTGDAQVFAPTACFNRDAASFYTKWLKDFPADQKADGSVPWVVPNVVEDGGGTGWSDGFGATGWADAVVIITWTMYKVYGDTRILSDLYGSMQAWTEYMIREAGDTYIFDSGFHFGDWLSFAEYYSYHYNAPDYGYAGAHTEKALIATAYFYYTTGLMQKIASLLGNDADSERYAAIRPKIMEAFQYEFLTRSGRLTSNTQTAYTLALSFGLLPDDQVAIAAQRLVDDVNHFGHLTTGFLGTPLICQALTENGYPEIAEKLLFNKWYPSWLYPITKGATTIWERWDGIKPDGSFQTAGMNSFNHYAYGAVGNWLYTTLAGINPDDHAPGYKRMIIRPYIAKNLNYVRARYHSMYGDIVSAWEKHHREVSLHIEIPPNTTALIHIPCADQAKIYEGGRPLSKIKEFQPISEEDGRTVLETGSGQYHFKFKWDDLI